MCQQESLKTTYEAGCSQTGYTFTSHASTTPHHWLLLLCCQEQLLLLHKILEVGMVVEESLKHHPILVFS